MKRKETLSWLCPEVRNNWQQTPLHFTNKHTIYCLLNLHNNRSKTNLYIILLYSICLHLDSGQVICQISVISPGVETFRQTQVCSTLCLRSPVFLCICICKKEKEDADFWSLLVLSAFSAFLPSPTMSHTAWSVLLKDSSQLFNALGMNLDHCINF